MKTSLVVVFALFAGAAAGGLTLSDPRRATANDDDDPDHKDPAQAKLCFDDDRNSQLSHEQMLSRHEILHWARPWKVPAQNDASIFVETPPTIKKIFYINVEQDEERKEWMEKQLGRKMNPVPFERFAAVPVANLTKTDEEHWQFSDVGIAPYLDDMKKADRQATKSVYYSHASVLKHIKNISTPDSEDIYMIMEDDVGLDPFWHRKLTKALATLPKDWDIARIVYWGAKRCQDKVPGTEEWYEARGPDMSEDGLTNMYAGNQAYLVRPKSLPDIMEQLRSMPVMDFDGAVGSAHKEGHNTTASGDDISWTWGIHTYNIQYPLGWHKNLGSSRLKKKVGLAGFGDDMEGIMQDASEGRKSSTPVFGGGWGKPFGFRESYEDVAV